MPLSDMRNPGRRHLAITALLLLLPLLFFWRETIGLRILGDQDATFWFLPAYRLVAAQLRAFTLPLWNPELYGGEPLLGAWQAGVFDPLNWIYTLCGATMRTLTLVQELSFSLALISLYAYARSIDLSRRASLFAAVIYAFGGYPVARTLYPGLLHVVALTPLALFCVERMRRSIESPRMWRFAVGGASVLAWQLFAAHPQPFLYSSLLAAAYALFYAADRPLSWPARRRFLKGCAVMFSGGVGLAMVQLLPAWEVARASVRSEWSYELFTFNSLHPVSLLVTLFPFFHGGGRGIYAVPFWGNYWHHHEAQIYLGVTALVLTLTGAIASLRARHRVMIFWTGAGLVGALLALGKYAGPLAWALYHVPVINNFRSPNRHWMEVSLAAATLSGYAIDRLWRLGNDEERALGRLTLRLSGFVALSAALIGGLAFWRRETLERLIRALPDLGHLPEGFLQGSGAEFWLPVILTAVSCLLLFGFIRARRRAYWFTALLVFLLIDLHLYASYAPISDPVRRTSLMGTAIPAELATEAARSPQRFHLLLNRAAGEFDPFWFAGREMVSGYDPLMSSRYKRFSGVEEAGRSYLKSIIDETDSTLDLLNVRYVMVAPQIFDDSTFGALSEEEREMARRWRRGLETNGRWRALSVRSSTARYGDHRIYENLRAAPRAWLAGRVEALDDWDRLRLMRGELEGRRFDLREVALISREDAERIDPQLRQNGAIPTGTVETVERRSNALTLEVETNSIAMVVLSEIYAPGWRARVDGVKAEVWRVNEVLRGVAVAPGKHRIEIWYWPWTLTVGLGVSVATAIAMAGIIRKCRVPSAER
jgi:hypothetical protein